MQSSDAQLLTGVRLLLFILLFLLIYLSTKESSKVIRGAWRLPVIYPNDSEDSARNIREREAMLLTLARRWNLLTVIDYSLGTLLIYEIPMGFYALELGMSHYLGVHIPSAVVISFLVGSFLAVVVIRLRSPFRFGRIEPLKHLESTLEELVNAVYAGDTTIAEDAEDILLMLVRKEIERFIEHRQMGDAECGRLLEYLSKQEGAVGRAASRLLWP
ncbi:MAG: hypothetical protein JSW05_07160 [Candidatus Thorarchaeota archaeon]|nr:MAG: hypothetical protein JSW05_07160 [Candidatus Thorarchaeota archaeon]